MKSLLLNEQEVLALKSAIEYLNDSESNEDYNGESNHILFFVEKLEEAIKRSEGQKLPKRGNRLSRDDSQLGLKPA